MTGESRLCAKCGRELPPQGVGRPRIYCSTACRRSAEFEIRRANDALGSLEEQIRWCRFGWGGRHESDIPKFAAELERLEGRLLQLLGGSNDDDE